MLAYVDLGPGNGGVSFDVGEGGMAFQGIQPLEKDQLVCINFKLPGINISMESTTQVAWLNESGKGGGLRFIDLPDDTRSKIKEWFSLRTMSRGLMEKTAASHAPVTAKNLKSSPAIHLVDIPENDSGAIHTSASDPVQGSSLPPVAATSAVQAGASMAATLGSKGLAQTPVAGKPSSGTESSGTWIARTLLVSLATVAILGAIVFLFRGRMQGLFTIEPQATDDVHLGLKLERSGPDWQVSWNQNADVLLKAVSAELSITDGQNTKELVLDPGELRSGSIMYTPATDDVVVRLRVVRGVSGQPISESVRVVGGASPQLPSKTKPAGSGSGEATGSGKATAVAATSAPRAARFPKEPAAQKATALAVAPANGTTPLKIDPSNASTDSERLAASAKAAMPRPTTMISRTADSTIPPVTPSLGPEPPQKLPTMLPEAPPPALSVREPARPGGKLDPAQILSRKAPVYPAEAKAAGISGRIELHFTIGADGHVRNVTVVAGNGLLARAAIEAVQGWHYTPARLAGTPVQSEADTAFVFQPN